MVYIYPFQYVRKVPEDKNANVHISMTGTGRNARIHTGYSAGKGKDLRMLGRTFQDHDRSPNIGVILQLYRTPARQ